MTGSEHQRRGRACRGWRAAALIATAGVLASACGAASAPKPVETAVMARSFAFEPGSLTFERQKPVSLTLRNPDAVEHDFQVDELRVRVESGDAGHSHAGEAHGHGGGPGSETLHVHADAGKETSLVFTPLTRGTFTVYCSVPGHKEAGMTATIIIT